MLLARARVQEIADDVRDFCGVRLQREVTGVEEADRCLWNVAPERFGTRRKEERIVLAPHRQQRRPMLAEVFVKPRVHRHVAGVVEEQIELDLVRARSCKVVVVQRVAIGRSIAHPSEILLLDEPLSNLDTRMRLELRIEFRRLHKTLGRTLIYVTHDQVEALSLADRVAVINQGSIIAEGTPSEIKAQTSGKRIRCITSLSIDSLRRIAGVAEVKQDREAVELHVREAESVVRELLARVRADLDQIDLIIVDLRLPHAPGVELIRSIRKLDDGRLPVLIFSCTIANADEVRELAALGVAGYVNEYSPVQHILPALAPPIPVPGHASYPSGHSTQAHLVAACVKLALPAPTGGTASPTTVALSAALDVLADRIARNREIAGLHYPSDSGAGVELAAFCLPLLQGLPSFDAIVTSAQKEWQ